MDVTWTRAMDVAAVSSSQGTASTRSSFCSAQPRSQVPNSHRSAPDTSRHGDTIRGTHISTVEFDAIRSVRPVRNFRLRWAATATAALVRLLSVSAATDRSRINESRPVSADARVPDRCLARRRDRDETR